MPRPQDPLRAALRPSSLVATLLLLVAVVLAVRGDLESRPIVRLDVDTGGPVTDARSSAATLTEYRVRAGDTLGDIAAIHDVAPDAIARANAIVPPYSLSPGRVLRIPDVAPSAEPPPPPPATARTGIADLLASWARDVGLRPDLLQAVTWRESSWRQDAVSDRGAIGIGQVLPGTAGWVSARLADGAPLDPRVLDDNVQLAARYLRWLIDRYDGDVAAALAAYHQGPEAVDRDGWYTVTEEYVADVFRLRRSF
jgi:transglycosylase-like protein with SLT domain/LysM domain-containing protein